MTDRPAIPARHFALFLRVFAALASVATWLVFGRFADEEPFRFFSTSDAIFYVGFGSAMVGTWLYFILAVGYGVLTRRLGLLWLLVFPLAAIGVCFSRYSVVGYLGDLIHFVLHP